MLWSQRWYPNFQVIGQTAQFFFINQDFPLCAEALVQDRLDSIQKNLDEVDAKDGILYISWFQPRGPGVSKRFVKQFSKSASPFDIKV